MPSDMDLYIGTINDYNNLITIATDDLQLGHNDTINEEQQIQQNQFDSPPDDFELVPDDPPLQPINEALQEAAQDESINKEELQQEAVQDESMNKASTRSKNKQEDIQDEPINKTSKNEELTHEENKLLLTLLGITLGSVIIWTLR